MLIRVDNLHKSFGEKAVLNGISFSLSKKESLVIIGGSGTGKSVLIKCVLGLINPDRGTVFYNNQAITTEKMSSFLKACGMLFQGGALFDSMTVVENIAFGLIQGKSFSKEEAFKIALEKLQAVDLPPNVANIYPAELSGGMQKRVALARAIAMKPEIIFFDEPTTGLDPILSSTINSLILRCVHDIGASTITITHDINSLRTIADRVALLHEGRFIWEGTVQEMDKTDNPYVQQFINGYPEGPFTTKH